MFLFIIILLVIAVLCVKFLPQPVGTIAGVICGVLIILRLVGLLPANIP